MFSKIIKKIYNKIQEEKPARRDNSLNAWNTVYYL